jgi:hypothetical protein
MDNKPIRLGIEDAIHILPLLETVNCRACCELWGNINKQINEAREPKGRLRSQISEESRNGFKKVVDTLRRNGTLETDCKEKIK